jgi:predicted transcriptional regulator
MDERVLDVETRRDIFELIQSNPGLHMREIARRLDMQLSLAEYHLNYLEDNNIIYTIKEGRYNRYYVDEDLEDRKVKLSGAEKRILHLLRQEVPLKIVVDLLECGRLTHKELKAAVEVSGSTLTYHLKKLVKAEIVIKVRRGKDKGFVLQDERMVVKILVLGKVKAPSQIENFEKMWQEFH